MLLISNMSLEIPTITNKPKPRNIEQQKNGISMSSRLRFERINESESRFEFFDLVITQPPNSQDYVVLFEGYEQSNGTTIKKEKPELSINLGSNLDEVKRIKDSIDRELAGRHLGPQEVHDKIVAMLPNR